MDWDRFNVHNATGITGPEQHVEERRPEIGKSAAPRALSLPATVRRRGTSLLNQQFWLWGQDIRCPEGNILLRHGFTRARPPDTRQGSRCYTLQLDPGRTVVLWGFGIFYGDRAHGGLYLSRFGLAPLLAASWDAPVGVWSPSDLPALTAPTDEHDWARTRPLLTGMLRWISAYECRVLDEMGHRYRQTCLASWPRAVCPAHEGATRWLRLARQCDDTLQRALPIV